MHRFYILILLIFISAGLSGQSNLNFSFEYGEHERMCRVYIPDVYDASTPVPLVISLHGFGGNGPQQQAYDELGLVADTAGFIIAYPTGYDNVWNAGEDYYGPWTSEDDVTYISQLIDTLGGMFTIDPSRVYACGMSNGGDMVYRLACELSNKIAAIASVTGTMITNIYESCEPAYKVPVVHFHGTSDDISDIDGGPGWVSLQETISLWKEINDCGAAEKTLLPDFDLMDFCRAYDITRTCSDEVLYKLFLIKKGGHTWPGSYYDAYTVWSFGRTNGDVNASVELWRFFNNYTRPEAPVFERSALAESMVPPQSLTIRPNPASSTITIDLADGGSKEYYIYIYDMNGRSVIQHKAEAGKEQVILSISTHPKGVYQINAIHENELKFARLIKN